ncbi:MAG: PAS domain-containing protein, partial [Candidatus Paceibacterota bacterium]
MELNNQNKEVHNNNILLNNSEKIKLDSDLINPNDEPLLQNDEKQKRTEALIIENFELNVELSKQSKKDLKISELQLSIDQLKLSSQYSRSLIEAIRDPIFTINTLGQVTDVNQATISVTNLNRSKLIGARFFNFFSDIEVAKKCLKDVFKIGFVVDIPLFLKDDNNTP